MVDKAKEIGKDEKVRDWFRRIRASESAKASYTKGIQYFLEFAKERDLGIGTTPEEFLKYAKERYRNDALDWKDGIEGIIAGYEDWLSEKPKIFTKSEYADLDLKLAPKTINNYISAVKSFLNAFNIEVPRRKGRKKPKTLVENNHRLTKEIVREALKYADVRAKAIISVMLSGGLDDSGVLQLKVGNFIRGRGYEPSQIGNLDIWINEEKRKCVEEINKGNLEQGITQLSIRRQKTQIDFLTHLNPEATISVLDYLAWRNRSSSYSERYKGIGKIREEKRKVRSPEDYLFIKAYVDDWYLPPEIIEKLKPAKISKGEINSKHKSRATTEIIKEVREKRKELKLKNYADVVRKLDRSGFMAIFRDLAKKTGVSTGMGTYQLLRGHNLRKLFYTLLRNEGIDSFTIEYWMGHAIPEEQAAYFQAIPDKLKTIYAKYMHVLFIGEFETKILESKEAKEIREELEGYKEALRLRNGELAKVNETIEQMKAEKAQTDDKIANLEASGNFIKLLSEDEKTYNLLEGMVEKLIEKKMQRR